MANELSNASIKKIYQDFPSNSLAADDLLVFYNESTGITKAIKASDAITNTSDTSSFTWTSTGTYNLDDVVIYEGQWYISLVDNNTVIPTDDGVNWIRENKVTAVTIEPWEQGIYEQSYTVVTVGKILYRIKSTTNTPFKSVDPPTIDIDHWEIIGGKHLTIAEIIDGIEAQEGLERLDAGQLRNIVTSIDAVLGGTAWRTNHFRGTYTSLSALQTAIPTANPGDRANVDPGVGSDVLFYIWDNDDSSWVQSSGGGSGLTASDIDTLAELNAILTDATLGDFSTLGTAAFKNTGTSGDAVPLLDQVATFGNRLEASNFFKLSSATITLTGSSLSNYAVPRSHITFVNDTQVMTINSIDLGLTGEKDIIFAISNLGDFDIIIKEASTATGDADNKFYIPSDLVVPPGNTVLFMFQTGILFQDGFYPINQLGPDTSYTDAQARAAQALLPSTGTAIAFDRHRKYGYPTILTGTLNFTFDFTNAIECEVIVRVNSSVEPTLPASAKEFVKGWKAGVDVYYYMVSVLADPATSTWEVHVTSSVAL